jgi:predicted DNA-binding transcriptional regulator AlpA
VSAKTPKPSKRKPPQKPWLTQASLHDPKENTASAFVPAIVGTYLLDRHQVCIKANTSYPTLWEMMRRGTFPRSRIVGGRSMWRSDEVDQWMAALPTRRLKGDAS